MKRRTATAAGIALVFALTLTVVGIGAATAQEDTPQPIENNTSFYDNETGETNTSDWVPGDGNTTAPGMLDMLSRVPGMFVGSGGLDPSGSGYQGVLLTGLVIGGATLMATMGIGVGVVAGSMLGMVVAYGLTAIGLIPPWIQPLLLFALVGVPVAKAILRIFNR